MSTQLETATLGGGCFWCLEAVYQDLEGVVKVESGYAGGYVANPTYEQVCSERTGHAEVVQVTFDPAAISYRDVLNVFFSIHDPTTRNRQGNDVGAQYRSAIFYNSPEQRATAGQVMAELAAADLWNGRAMVTALEPLEAFYKAEGYHQNYYRSNPRASYCQVVIFPKVVKFRKQFASRLKK